MESQIIVGDALKVTHGLPAGAFQTVVTSPPYWGLRDYGTQGQLGQENDYKDYIKNLTTIFHNIKNALKPDGTLWLNIGDTYVGTGHKKDSRDPKYKDGRNGQSVALNHKVEGFKPKDMMGLPWRVAFSLQDDGWYLRSDIVWNKGNANPSPVKDRPVSSHEFIFLMSKNRKYFYDYESVKEITKDGKGKRSLRDVWVVNTQPFPDAHFAVYPESLILPCVLAGSRGGDIVLDPFNGTGTTGIVALKNGRKYVGIELNEKFAIMSQKRILEATGVKLPIVFFEN